MRRQAESAEAEMPPAIVPAPRLAPTEATRRWATLLQQLFAVDPLACPACHGVMRLVALITQPSVIDQILSHFRARAATGAHADDTQLKEYKGFTHDVHPMRGADGMIHFSSERDGIFNLWKIAPTGGAPTQVTKHKEDGVQFPSMSPDGRHLIYENDFDLWVMDAPDGAPRKLNLRVSADAKENDISTVTSTNRADGFARRPQVITWRWTCKARS